MRTADISQVRQKESIRKNIISVVDSRGIFLKAKGNERGIAANGREEDNE